MKDLLDRLDAWLAAHAPTVAASLQAPAPAKGGPWSRLEGELGEASDDHGEAVAADEEGLTRAQDRVRTVCNAEMERVVVTPDDGPGASQADLTEPSRIEPTCISSIRTKAPRSERRSMPSWSSPPPRTR